MPRLPAPPFLYAILDANLLRGRAVADVIAQLARGGAALVQLRAKFVNDAALLRLAREARSAAREYGLPLIVNDRADVARLVDADGVHVGRTDLPAAGVRSVIGDQALLGLSTHDFGQAVAASEEPVDYVAFGPVFPTRTKQAADPVVGIAGLRRIRARVARPLVAIGGITRGNVADVVKAGADGVAVISDLLEAEDVEGATRELVGRLPGRT